MSGGPDIYHGRSSEQIKIEWLEKDLNQLRERYATLQALYDGLLVKYNTLKAKKRKKSHPLLRKSAV